MKLTLKKNKTKQNDVRWCEWEKINCKNIYKKLFKTKRNKNYSHKKEEKNEIRILKNKWKHDKERKKIKTRNTYVK